MHSASLRCVPGGPGPCTCKPDLGILQISLTSCAHVYRSCKLTFWCHAHAFCSQVVSVRFFHCRHFEVANCPCSHHSNLEITRSLYGARRKLCRLGGDAPSGTPRLEFQSFLHLARQESQNNSPRVERVWSPAQSDIPGALEPINHYTMTHPSGDLYPNHSPSPTRVYPAVHGCLWDALSPGWSPALMEQCAFCPVPVRWPHDSAVQTLPQCLTCTYFVILSH